MTNIIEKEVLDHGFVKLLNISGPENRLNYNEFDDEAFFVADDVDPAKVARISFDNLDAGRTEEQDLKLYEYLIANWHTTPVEMIETWWHMQMPIFVARQLVRHRTAAINEVSARYTVLPDKWYIPEKEFVGLYTGNVKQGRTGTGQEAWEEMTVLQKEVISDFLLDLNRACGVCFDKYKYYIAAGVAPELARCFLHLNHYTHWVYKMDLHNLMHFMALRCDGHAQYEAQVYGNAVYEILKQFLPKSMELFDTYRRKLTDKEKAHLKVLAELLTHVSDSAITDETRNTFAKVLKRSGVK